MRAQRKQRERCTSLQITLENQNLDSLLEANQALVKDKKELHLRRLQTYMDKYDRLQGLLQKCLDEEEKLCLNFKKDKLFGKINCEKEKLVQINTIEKEINDYLMRQKTAIRDSASDHKNLICGQLRDTASPQLQSILLSIQQSRKVFKAVQKIPITHQHGQIAKKLTKEDHQQKQPETSINMVGKLSIKEVTLINKSTQMPPAKDQQPQFHFQRYQRDTFDISEQQQQEVEHSLASIGLAEVLEQTKVLEEKKKRLQKQILLKRIELEKINATVAAQISLNTNLCQQNQKKLSLLRQLDAKHQEKILTNQALLVKLQNLKAEESELKMVLENYETSLADLTCKLATTISDISQKQESLSMLSAELTDLRQQQSSQLSEYIEQKQHINDQRQQLLALEQSKNGLKNTIDGLRLQAAQIQQQIGSKKHLLAETTNLQHLQQKQVNTLSADIVTKQTLLKLLEDKIEKKSQEIQSLSTQLQQCSNQCKQRLVEQSNIIGRITKLKALELKLLARTGTGSEKENNRREATNIASASVNRSLAKQQSSKSQCSVVPIVSQRFNYAI